MNLKKLKKVVDFKQKFYPRKWAKYEEANPEHIKLLPENYRYSEIEEDYNNMKEMFFGNYPTFTEMMENIKSLEEEIHNINKK